MNEWEYLHKYVKESRKRRNMRRFLSCRTARACIVAKQHIMSDIVIYATHNTQ